MLKTVFTAAALVATAAPAFAAETQTFTRDGQTYVYTKVASNDRIVLDGRNTSTGEPFHLTVVGARVSGVANGRAVSFAVPAGKSATQIAAR